MRGHEQQLTSSYHSAQFDFRTALCDSFNTPTAISVLMDLIAKVNIYFSSRGREYNIAPVQVIAQWITRMLKMFGLGEGAAAGESEQIGWGKAGEDAGAGDVSARCLSIAFCLKCRNVG